jgi:hypothetical protein
VQFGLQFETPAAREPAVASAPSKDVKRRGAGQSVAPAAEPKRPPSAQPPAAAGEPEPRAPAQGAEVVSLDRFRKK